MDRQVVGEMDGEMTVEGVCCVIKYLLYTHSSTMSIPFFQKLDHLRPLLLYHNRNSFTYKLKNCI